MQKTNEWTENVCEEVENFEKKHDSAKNGRHRSFL